ncbi:MAG TPA: hypothetical protein DHU76_07915, partial [Ruminococcus sp.]|nr:hypothetical protein [Ruminococcus sp.]
MDCRRLQCRRSAEWTGSVQYEAGTPKGDTRSMKILIATDSFKGSLSSLEAGNAIADGIR